MSTPINPVTEASKAGSYPARRFNKRERKIVQSVESYTPANPAAFAVQPTSVQGALDQLAAQGSAGVSKLVAVTYDFSVNGGAIGTIPLGVTIPNACVIDEVTVDVQVAPTGTAGGTLTLNVPTDGNLAPALVTGTAVQGPIAQNTGSPLPKKTTAARILQVTIATQALTAGKATFFIRYLQSA